MFNTTKTVRRLFLIAALSSIAAAASAFNIDPQIMIDRALDSPTLTVRYTGVSAALVELKVNGESLGTRTMSVSKNAGETNFTLNLSDLREGDNDVEVRLFDKTGKLVAHDHTNISTAPVEKGPVFLSSPKMGATVSGPVQVKVAFGKELKNSYVSFFVDGNFKSMTNFPPYEYVWDSERVPNGWHELEAWAIDDSNETHKTRKVRVYINNISGRTDRIGVSQYPTPTKNPVVEVVGSDKGLKRVSVGANGSISSAKPMGLPPVVRDSHTNLVAETNSIRLALGPVAGSKPIVPDNGIPTGQRHLLPTGRRVAQSGAFGTANKNSHAREVVMITPSNDRITLSLPKGQAIRNVTDAASLVTIVRGSRVPDLGHFEVVFNDSFVNFDVAPRVDSGVPMTPLRFLLEKAGGKVRWENISKKVSADADGNAIELRIGDTTAFVNQLNVLLERAPYIDGGRTIVPLSFIRDALKVDVQYDKATGHVLITSLKK